ncbi:S phase cyclin A-associated protein in the endoplasmic reticulum-like [Asterias rubens]|uniref:S phase cyclin A-associated protein in the endoplasmic reticulum-like n=1 Tax=Asterias rubens TaxID=7604 RepID=UPI001455D7A0|nr:S phase cyclin A-associated protein in the endoplasmic reticulum-like [Asterias rubens]
MSEFRRKRSSNGTKQRFGNSASAAADDLPSSNRQDRLNSKPPFSPSSSAGGKMQHNKPNDRHDRDRNNSGKSPGSGPLTLRGKTSSSKAAYTRSLSDDKVRRIVNEEGRQARNLVTWNVPVDDSDDSENEGKPPVRRKPKSRSSSTRSSPRTTTPRKKTDSPRVSPRDQGDSIRFSTVNQKAERKNSTASTTATKKVDLRARYWAFLFDNLQRAVDEIYQTCEADESIVECKEVIMILKRATHDFESLIKRINVQTEFEKCDIENRPTSIVWEVRKSSSPAKHRTPSWPPDSRAPTPRRPNSLAWEIRKISPGRGLGSSPTPGEGRDTPSPVSRSLNFSGQDNTKVRQSPVPLTETIAIASWADRVKGRTAKPIARFPADKKPDNKQVIKEVYKENIKADVKQEINGQVSTADDDGEGWETVQRSKPGRSRPSSFKGRSHHSSTSSSHSVRSQSGTNPASDTVKAPIKTTSSNQGAPRSRTDSEKENTPVDNVNISREKSNVNQGVKVERSEVVKVESQEKVTKTTTENQLPKEKLNIQDLDPAIVAICIGKEEILLPSGDEEDHNKNLEKEDLATKLDEDVAAAIDEEESLTFEIQKCQDEALASAIAEEEKLTKEIEEEESKEIIVETDEGESDLALSTNTLSSLDSSQRTLDWNDMLAEYEERQHDQSPVSWGEMVEMNDLEGRSPGYALHMHEKLSSPSRKRTRAEAQKRHEERQAKAQRKREVLHERKSVKLKMLHEKIEEVRDWKDELLMMKKKDMDEKQQRAEQKRQLQLEAVRRKAQEEEQKANEIAFINCLEAQNKKHDIMARHMGHEARLQDIVEERQRKNVEKAAKEEAVQERRKAIEEDRMTRLKEMQKHRQVQEDKINVLREQRERSRESAAKERAREREQRLSALNAAQLAKEEEIQKKIQQKHDETTRRHNQQIEQKREKAIELSMLRHYRTTDVAPKHNPYEKKKMCSLCAVMIPSEVYLLSHLRGKKHKEAVLEKHQGKHMNDEEIESYSLKLLVDASLDRPDPQEMAEKERQKGCRKRARKLRQRMASKGKEYENNLPSKTPQGNESHLRAKLQKLIKDLNKYLQSQDASGPWEQSKVSAMDRALGEINRILAKKEQADQITFRACGGLSTLTRILMLADSGSNTVSNIIPAKSVCSAANAFRLGCKGCFDNCQYALYSGKVAPIVELLVHQLGLIDPQSSDLSTDLPKTIPDPISSCLMQLLSTVLFCLVKYRPQSPSSDSRSNAQKKQTDIFDQCGQDLISYLVCCGVIDSLTSFFNCVRGTVDENPSLAEFLQHSLGLLGAMTKFVSTASNRSSIFTAKKEDPTQLLTTFKATGFSGIISLLYGILLHGGNPPRGSTATPPELPEHTLNVVNAGIKMLSNIAVLDLEMMQSALGAEGISLEFRHIATYLIWYCSHFVSCEDLLHEIILIVGYFTILNTDNQVLVQSGNTPTLLQQLCGLPFQYFSDPRLMAVLFPALMACCYNNQENKIILEQEMSCSLLSCFLEEKIQEKKKVKQTTPTTSKIREKERDKDLQARTSFELRFPESSWDDAVKFFSEAS